MNAMAQHHRVSILEEFAKRKLELAAILGSSLH
jgi:hypothetical protein